MKMRLIILFVFIPVIYGQTGPAPVISNLHIYRRPVLRGSTTQTGALLEAIAVQVGLGMAGEARRAGRAPALLY